MRCTRNLVPGLLYQCCVDDTQRGLSFATSHQSTLLGGKTPLCRIHNSSGRQQQLIANPSTTPRHTTPHHMTSQHNTTSQQDIYLVQHTTTSRHTSENRRHVFRGWMIKIARDDWSRHLLGWTTICLVRHSPTTSTSSMRPAQVQHLPCSHAASFEPHRELAGANLGSRKSENSRRVRWDIQTPTKRRPRYGTAEKIRRKCIGVKRERDK